MIRNERDDNFKKFLFCNIYYSGNPIELLTFKTEWDF